MPVVICVTCYRDWNDIFRQITSFYNYLPTDFTIIYVIEDVDPTEWLKCWNNCHLRNMPNVSILIGNDLLPINAHGWIRQQLLKLIVASQQTDICWVIDSKNFLINRPVGQVGNPPYLNRYDRMAHTGVIDLYKSVLNVENTEYLVLPHTPFEFSPANVRHLIGGFSGYDDFANWFISMPFHSEFFLYQMWCHKHNLEISSIGRLQKVTELWAPTTPAIGDSIHLCNAAIVALSASTDVTWVSKHRWAGVFWDSATKTRWNTLLLNHNLPILDKDFSDRYDIMLFSEFCRHKAGITKQ